MKWVIKNEVKGAPIFWNEKDNEWTANRMKATEFTTHQEAGLVAHEHGGWLVECTMIEQPKSESSTKSD